MDFITNDANKFMMILGIVAMALGAFLAKTISAVKGSFTPYVKATIIYSVLSLLFFAAIALAAHPGVFTDTITLYIFFQCYFLLLGLVHFHLMHRFLHWSGDESSFWPETLFTVVVSMFGSICFILIYRLVNVDGMVSLMPASCYMFILPGFFYHTFRKAISIPPKVIKQWFYPFNEEVAEPDEAKFKNLLVISFEFQKQTGDGHFTNFRAKAPSDMEFGQLFYYFINDYNERHSNAKIEFVNHDGDVHGWVFYKKPSWYSIVTRYIDTDRTIYTNKIRENDVIICSRSSR